MWPCERLLTIDSTQREALRRLNDRSQQAHGFGLWTTRQTAGIASHGRVWRDSPGGGLAASFVWPEAETALPAQAAWPIRLSLMLLEILESRYGPLSGMLGLKWPNDVMAGSSKLAGVLVSRHRVRERWWLVAGIGLNLAWDHDPDLDRPVTGLRNLGVGDIDTEQLVQALCTGVQALTEEDIAASRWWERYARHDHWQGEHVCVVHPLHGGLIAQGIHCGISAEGKLRLLHRDAQIDVAYGEVSLRKVEPIS